MKLDKSTITARDVNIPFSIIDGKIRQKISNDIENLNNTIKEPHLINIYKRLHSQTTKHIFSVACGACSSIKYIVTTMKVSMDFEWFNTKYNLDHNTKLKSVISRSLGNSQIFENSITQLMSCTSKDKLKTKLERILNRRENKNTTCQIVWYQLNQYQQKIVWVLTSVLENNQ